MNEEKTYPIYKFSMKWNQDGTQDKNYPSWHIGLPENRIWNSISYDKMYKEELKEQELHLIIIKEWGRYKRNKLKGKKPSIPILKVEFMGRETWCLTWFQHYTFDVGQTDQEALMSFNDFVERKRKLGEDKYCLMGAEDRWRWHGAEPNGKQDDRSEPPCRCKYCKKQGLIRIAH